MTTPINPRDVERDDEARTDSEFADDLRTWVSS
jgi:hypothetical protein